MHYITNFGGLLNLLHAVPPQVSTTAQPSGNPAASGAEKAG
jgi:hypothetical protein